MIYPTRLEARADYRSKQAGRSVDDKKDGPSSQDFAVSNLPGHGLALVRLFCHPRGMSAEVLIVVR